MKWAEYAIKDWSIACIMFVKLHRGWQHPVILSYIICPVRLAMICLKSVRTYWPALIEVWGSPCCGSTFLPSLPAGHYWASSLCGRGVLMYFISEWCLITLQDPVNLCKRSTFESHCFNACCSRKRRLTTQNEQHFWDCCLIPCWMNEWVGPDINVVGTLQIPPSDEFAISESSHFFGKSA